MVVRRASSPAAVAALIAANLLPLAGVLWWGWSVFEVLVLYWLESGIVGALNVPKILLAGSGGDSVAGTDADGEQRTGPDGDGRVESPARTDSTRSDTDARVDADGDGERRTVTWQVEGVPTGWFSGGSGPSGYRREGPRTASETAERIGLAGFFVLHYGIFWIVHGVFVFVLPLFALGTSGTAGGGVGPGWGFGTAPEIFLLAVASMVLSHGVSFATNYLGRREYRSVTPDQQMMRPYGRVVVLHLTVLFGAWLVASIGSPVAVLALLIALKTALDLGTHLREHRGVGASASLA